MFCTYVLQILDVRLQQTLLYFTKFYFSHSSVVFENEWSLTSAPDVCVLGVDRDRLPELGIWLSEM